MDLSSPRTLLTLTVLMVAARCFTSLLSKLAARSGLSARIESRCESLWQRRPRFGRKSPPTPEPAQWSTATPTVTNGALVFDIEPRERLGGLDMSTLTADLAKLAKPPAVLNQNGSVPPAGEHLASVTYLQERKRG